MIISNPINLQISNILKRIKIIRIQKGITQYEMSSRMNVSQNTYFKIETGKTKMDLYRLIQISNILEFDLSSFFESKDISNQELDY